MLGIRQKLALGFGGLLAIILFIGIQSVTLLTELGGSVEVILRENYRSVIACQDMKEALQRIDHGVLFTLQGYPGQRAQQIDESEKSFQQALEVELHNITLPGEGEKARRLQELFSQFRTSLEAVKDPSSPHEKRSDAYFTQLLPLFQRMERSANAILHMNQKNMIEANERARQTATAARRRMIVLLIVGAVVAVGFMSFTEKWILRPIARLIDSAHEIKSGNLDLVVRVDSKDEIGTLSEAFNAMAAGLREFRRARGATLVRIQRSTEQAFRFLPDAVVIVDPEGNSEVASAIALEAFQFKPGERIIDSGFQQVIDLFYEALKSGREAEPGGDDPLIQRFVRGEERYFRPRAVPILDEDRQPTGVIIILSDVTQERQQNELKRGVIATVAHELRTPLTSVRMAVHLLLEERVGILNDKQAELLLAAREDTERLHTILEKLLTISRIESGKARLDRQATCSRQLVFESVDPFQRAAQDRGITLTISLGEDLPEVLADSRLIGQVFANLLSNALKYTDPGGAVRISAQPVDDSVVFSVSDTGKGIPNQYLQKILEQFFRVPGQEANSGAGLGLSIVQEIVAAHGGTVQVESAEGTGSTFSFSLKRSDGECQEELHDD